MMTIRQPRDLRRFSRVLLFGTYLLFSSSASAYVDEVVHPLETISAYQPTYFIMGHPDTKIQLSFKATLLRTIPLYFAYSQLMIWETFEESAPFTDIDYDPEAFYRILLGEPARLQWLDLGLFEHESNGRGGDASRSWNRVYVRYSDTIRIGSQDKTKFHWSLKAWVPFAQDPGNIARYRGLWEATLSVSDFLGLFWERDDLTLRFYTGGATYMNPLQGGQELTYRAKIRAREFLPLFVFQLFHGYGEDLLNYNESRLGVRAGIGL